MWIHNKSVETEGNGMERGAFHINNQENRLRQTKQEDEKRKIEEAIEAEKNAAKEKQK